MMKPLATKSANVHLCTIPFETRGADLLPSSLEWLLYLFVNIGLRPVVRIVRTMMDDIHLRSFPNEDLL